MWLYDHAWGHRNAERRRDRSFCYLFLYCWSYFLLIGGTVITVRLTHYIPLPSRSSLTLSHLLHSQVLGTYGSVSGIIDEYAGQELAAFSCADNSS